jgi:prepilin-type N-terminal cleavage/methylation domain-containing protein
MKRRQAGFSFIEILVVMGIISVLVSMVVVVVPIIQEKAKRTKSTDNVRSMILMYISGDAGLARPWPKFNGKNFVLWLVATNKIDRGNRQNLEVLFSPGDGKYTLEPLSDKDYEPVTLAALRAEGHDDFRRLTSYAGRRNKESGHELTSEELSKGALIICDDDDGPLHHSAGMVLGFSSGTARFMEWSDLDMSKPADTKNPEGILGDNSPNENLKHMSSGN